METVTWIGGQGRVCISIKLIFYSAEKNELKMQKAEAQAGSSAILLCARALEKLQVFYLQTPSRTMHRVMWWARFTPPAQDVPSPAPCAVGLKPELRRPLSAA